MSRPFDIVAHHRARSRRAEARAESLERQRAQLDRLLALALDVATGNGRGCDRLALLAVLEAVDERMQRAGPDLDALVALLRETNPTTHEGES